MFYGVIHPLPESIAPVSGKGCSFCLVKSSDLVSNIMGEGGWGDGGGFRFRFVLDLTLH